MKTIALYGTESGHAEEVALAIVKALPEFRIEARDMADADPADIDLLAFLLVICSTHASGELPGFAQFFHDDLRELGTDLTGLRYAVFGLGDSSYEDRYNRGARLFDELLSALGAQRVGRVGEHDAMSRQDHVTLGVAWAREIMPQALERGPT